MRGSFDDTAGAFGAPPGGRTQEAGETPRRRPPGGKALLRQLQMLESAGLTQAAREAVEAAVSAENRDEAMATAERFAAAPMPAAPPARPRRRPRTGEAGQAGAGEQSPGAAETAALANAYLQAGLRKSRKTFGPATGTGPQWTSLGPWTVPNGQTYGTSRVNVSGRVSAIAVDPSDPAHVLCGAANGGVWESRDRGASWTPRTDFAPTLAVGAVVFDPSNPMTVYCGTGEGNWWSFLGAGVLRSTDGGATWSSICTDPFVGQGFYDLVVDPADGQQLLAATSWGLYTSADGGATWTQRRATRTWSLAIARVDRARREILAGCSDGLFSSTDGGASWTAVALPGAPQGFDRLAVAFAPSNPTVAFAWGASGSTGYLWRRVGPNWKAVGAPPGVNTGQAWYDWYLAVAPDRDTQVYCGAIEIHRGDLSGTTWTWTNLSSKGATGDSIHPDQHAIAFEPGRPDRIYVGCDGGLYCSDDRGIHWQHCNNGLVITEFEYLAQHPGSARWLIGGTQDNGTERWTGSQTWEHVDDGDGGDVGVNRTVPPTVFHTYFNMSPVTSTGSGDFGSWSGITPPIPGGEGSLFYPPLECSATDGDTIAIGGDALYVSRNNGAAWMRLAYPNGGRSSAMYIPNANTVFAGTTDGRIFRTTWNGSSWTALTALIAPRANAYASDIFADPANLNRLWVTHRTVGGGRAWRSDDGGATWTDCTAGLPDLPLNAIEVDPTNANRVWVAADLGIYESSDGGASWTDFSNGLPNAFIGDLVFHPQARVLRAGTRNRGAWEMAVDGPLAAPICGVQFTGHLDGNQTARWFTFNWPATWHVVWTAIPTTPRPGSPQLTWKVQVERATPEYVTYWITATNLTPDPLDFEGRFCILSRY